jgi:hypothetical protein
LIVDEPEADEGPHQINAQCAVNWRPKRVLYGCLTDNGARCLVNWIQMPRALLLRQRIAQTIRLAAALRHIR